MPKSTNGAYIFTSPIEFSLHVEQEAVKNSQTVLESLLNVANTYDIEIEDLKPLLSESLIQKLRKDYENLGLLPKEKTNVLDFL